LIDFFQMAFEWFTTVIWDRYGPVAGVCAGLTFVALLVAAAYLIISLI
jgi:hypothetical protein